MNQQEAIKALAEWMGEDPAVTQAPYGDVNTTTRHYASPRLEYLRLLSANVAAVTRNADAHSTPASGVVKAATLLTHATIQSLVTGAKEGGE